MESRHQKPQLHYDGTEGACDIMEAVVQLYGGGSVVLAPLLEWETTLTGGVPCDSFYLKCLYHAAQAALLNGPGV